MLNNNDDDDDDDHDDDDDNDDDDNNKMEVLYLFSFTLVCYVLKERSLSFTGYQVAYAVWGTYKRPSKLGSVVALSLVF